MLTNNHEITHLAQAISDEQMRKQMEIKKFLDSKFQDLESQIQKYKQEIQRIDEEIQRVDEEIAAKDKEIAALKKLLSKK